MKLYKVRNDKRVLVYTKYEFITYFIIFSFLMGAVEPIFNHFLFGG